MHYFSPVDKMPLLEIITHEGTAPHVTAAAFEVGARQGKTVIVVKDVPGFYVNRCLGPYMAEIMALLQHGVEPQRLDKVMRDFGFPVGPIALADEVGIDVAGHVQTFLGSHLGQRMHGAVGGATLLENMLKGKLLGRKSGAGFYVYETPEEAKKNKKQVVRRSRATRSSTPPSRRCSSSSAPPAAKWRSPTTRSSFAPRRASSTRRRTASPTALSPTSSTPTLAPSLASASRRSAAARSAGSTKSAPSASSTACAVSSATLAPSSRRRPSSSTMRPLQQEVSL
jgi:hypothetical protein